MNSLASLIYLDLIERERGCEREGGIYITAAFDRINGK
jgi:hypothetical protein